MQKLARLEGILGKKEESLSHMQQAAILDPLDWGIQTGLAVAYSGAGQFDQSLETLRRVREMEPGRSGTHYRFGRHFLRTGKYNEALEEFKLETFDFLSVSGQALVGTWRMVGSEEYLTKPFTKEQLLRAVEAFRRVAA